MQLLFQMTVTLPPIRSLSVEQGIRLVLLWFSCNNTAGSRLWRRALGFVVLEADFQTQEPGCSYPNHVAQLIVIFLFQYNYIGFLDYKKETIRKLAMKANTCSFNPGVFVANLTEWKLQNITKQLEKWMALNVA